MQDNPTRSSLGSEVSFSQETQTLAVLIPCHNEEVTIGTVVSEMRAALPCARIFVYDNNSTDRTVAVAREVGAIVRHECRQGKGHVIRRMFADVEADFYLLIDGDNTYDATAALKMVTLAQHAGHDVVMGVRVHEKAAAYRKGHVLGNRLLTGLLIRLFGCGPSDMLSGYRVFSRRFVKSFTALSGGFETEVELTVHALQLNMSVGEVLTRYAERPEGSFSKLNTYRDGFRIFGAIVVLLKQERPIKFFGMIGFVLACGSALAGTRSIIDFIETHTVPRLPSAILATGCAVLAALSLVCGLILHSVALGRLENKRLAYLAIKAPSSGNV